MRQSSKGALPDRAYTLIEVLMVIIVLGSVLGIAGAFLIRTYHRIGASSEIIDTHIDLGIAADLMERDIRESAAISAEDGSLRLTRVDGANVEWSVRVKALMRNTSDGTRAWRTPIAAMTVDVGRPRPASVYVEAVIESEASRDTPRQTFYVCARQRIGETQ
jgi:prepilin-type N-terminal cleavage/methylation domain-containing protein